MTRDDIKLGLRDVFEEVLGIKNIALTDAITANDVKGWDSLAHIDIILATEEKFNVRISASEASKLKCVGELIDLISYQKK